eukprot:5877941-Pyramimonas_sp.AAC.1
MVACMDVARAKKLSFGALFVDLQAAFASIARHLAFSCAAGVNGCICCQTLGCRIFCRGRRGNR